MRTTGLHLWVLQFGVETTILESNQHFESVLNFCVMGTGRSNDSGEEEAEALESEDPRDTRATAHPASASPILQKTLPVPKPRSPFLPVEDQHSCQCNLRARKLLEAETSPCACPPVVESREPNTLHHVLSLPLNKLARES